MIWFIIFYIFFFTIQIMFCSKKLDLTSGLTRGILWLSPTLPPHLIIMEITMGTKTGRKNHTHKYFMKHDGLWACSGIDGCTHYMPKNMSPAPIGRPSICWSCNREFELDYKNMKNPYPICDACTAEVEAIEGQQPNALDLLKKHTHSEEDQIEVIDENEN